MATKKTVPDEQINLENVNNEETKPVDNPAPADESTKESENKVKDNGVKEEKKTILRKVADWADAKDQKNAQKKADKLHKQEQKKAEKEAKKTQKDDKKSEATLGSKLKKGALIVGGAVVAIGGGLLAYEMSKPCDGAAYVDNGTPTTYIPEQTQTTVEETSIEPAVTETNSSETAGTVVETTSNE